MSVILATAGYDHKIRFWEAPSGICSRVIKFPDSQVNQLQITPDKQFIAAAGNPHIRLYEILHSSGNPGDGGGGGGMNTTATEPPTQQPVLTLEGHTGAVTSIGFQRDGRYLYSGSEDGTIKVWDLRNPNYSRSFDSKGGVNSVCLRVDRDEFISGDQNGFVKVWDLGGNGCVHSIKPSSAPLYSSEEEQQQRQQQQQQQQQQVTNNVTSPVVDHQPPQPQPQPLQLQYSEGENMAGGSQQHYRKKMVQRAYHEGTVPIQAVDISDDSRTIVACSNHGTVFVWNDENTRNLNNNNINNAGGGGGGNNNNDDGPPPYHHHPQQQQQQQHQYHPHHPMPPPPITAELLSQPLYKRFRAHNETPGHYCLHGKMAPDGRHFVTTGSDGYALLWNTSTWECAQRLKNQKWVWDAAFCADSSYLVTASSDHIARLWNLRTGDVVRQYHGHQSAVTCVALNDSSV